MKVVVVIFGSLLALAIANAAEVKTQPVSAGSNSPAVPVTEKKVVAKKAAKPAEEKVIEVKTLVVEDLVQGKGKAAQKGKTIKVNYTGWLYDPKAAMGRGKQFDSSVGKEAFAFPLGAGQVIKGWDDGFENMKVGGKRKLLIPASLGYGSAGAGNVIPPNAVLMFEVELVDVM